MPASPLNFQVFSHTADIGLAARGRTLRELFRHAALGMTSLWTDPASIEIRRRDVIRVKAENAEDLLVAWLNELLMAVSAKKIIYREFRILSFKDFELKAEALGQKIRSGKPEIFREIKAVTYHDLKIRRAAGGYFVRIIFDI